GPKSGRCQTPPKALDKLRYLVVPPCCPCCRGHFDVFRPSTMVGNVFGLYPPLARITPARTAGLEYCAPSTAELPLAFRSRSDIDTIAVATGDGRACISTIERAGKVPEFISQVSVYAALLADRGNRVPRPNRRHRLDYARHLLFESAV